MTIARIEVFRPGRFTPMEGVPLSFSAADLRAVADSYDPETAPAPIVVGHPVTDAPAFGWVQSFDFDATAERLYANIGEMEPAFSDAVKSGRYKKVSLSFFRPEHSANPIPGTWYPKHIGFLGAAAPAVPGLRNVQFAGSPDAAVTFSAELGVGRAAGGLFRGLRDFFIEKFGIEDADRVLPTFEIEWLSQFEEDMRPQQSFAAPAGEPAPIAAPVPETTPATIQDNPMTNRTETDPAFAAREAELEARATAIAEREAAARHADNVSFAEGLVAGGKLLPASRDQVASLLDDLGGAGAASFSAEADPVARLRAILEAQPVVVQFGAAALEDDAAAPASFSADGKQVANADVHARALAWQAKHPDTPYLDAVKAVQA